ncbi:MAG: hypothetical protein ABIH84_02730 [bacterium]
MLVESYHRGHGFINDFSGVNPVAVGIFIAKALIHARKYHSVIEGHHLPTTGPAILTSNHHREDDVYKGVLVALRDGRLSTRAVMKKILIDPNARESEKYLQSIGAKYDDSKKPSRMQIFVLKGIGVIPVLRDNPGTDVATQCNKVLNAGRILSIFLMPSRNEECLLRNLQLGVAILAIRHPEIPICPLASSGSPDGPDKIIVLKPFTYAEKVAELGRKPRPGELIIMIADMIATALPERSQQDWQTRREEELERLISPRK